MAFPATVIDIFVEVALGADLTASPSTWAWTDATDYVYTRDGITITRGGRDGVAQSPPSTCSFTVNNSDGRWVPTNPTGAWFGQLVKNTPVRVRTNESSSSVRWTGFLSSLPPRWDPSENDRYVTVTASGIMQRLQRGSTPLRSALVLEIAGSIIRPAGYWPGEDASGASSIAEYFGGAPMALTGQVVTLASDGPDGSSPLPEFTTVSGSVGILPTRPATGDGWTVMQVINFPASPSTDTIVMRWRTSGTYPIWDFILSPGTPDSLTLRAIDSAGVQQLADVINFAVSASASEAIGSWVIITASAEQNGTAVDYQFSVLDQFGGIGLSGSEAGITTGQVTRIGIHADAKSNSMLAGHWAVWDDSGGFNGLGSLMYTGALNGYLGEYVYLRAPRVAGGPPGVYVEIDGFMPVAMGPQPQAAFLDILRECEAVSGGRLYENRNPAQYGMLLHLKQGIDLENQAVALTLDHDAGRLAPPFEPTDDDQNVRNDVTATRSGASGTGSSARVVADSGALTPALVGTYDDSVSVNVETDDLLAHQAGWRVNVGTVEGLRFPVVTLDLARNPSLIATWITCDIGSRIQITNPPAGIAPDTIDLLIEGWTEFFGPHSWTVTLNCSPYGPWHVFQIAASTADDDPFLGRLAGDEKAAIRTALTSTDVGTVGFDPNFYPWTSNSDDFDPDLRIRLGGEVIEISAITSTAATYVAAGAASHADNAAVAPALFAGATIRRLILVLAAIRSSGTGTLVTPTGYTRLPVFAATDNVQLYAKSSNGSESNPTITPSGGAAGDTVSAFTFGFANMPGSTLDDPGDIVIDSIAQLGASAQNIAYGGLYPWTQDGCVHLIVGWKQDDCTSIAVPAGYTEILEASTTTGNDQSLYAAYRIDTTPAVTNEGSLVVTGGASAISRSAVVAIAGGFQTMTIAARSLNGVVKAQAAGTRIEVEDPAVLAL